MQGIQSVTKHSCDLRHIANNFRVLHQSGDAQIHEYLSDVTSFLMVSLASEEPLDEIFTYFCL